METRSSVVIALLTLFIGASMTSTSLALEPPSAADAEPASLVKDDVANDQQPKDLTQFERFNQRAEELFKVMPVPLIYYSSQSGTVYGLAKYNLFQLSKDDRISPPSKVEGVVSMSSGGQFFVGGGGTLFFGEDHYIFRSELELKDFPEDFFGIGNSVSVSDREEITVSNFGAGNQLLYRVGESVFAGGVLEYWDFSDIDREQGSYLDQELVTGRDGGISVGLGATLIHDSRDNRHNPASGSFAHLRATFFSGTLGSDFSYEDYSLDVRKYFNPWQDHVIAVQGYTGTKVGEVPFYDLNELGGPNRMRGYYQGALRDKAIIDAQVEYRMPVWSIFGVAGFVGAGRVAESYGDMSTDDIRLSYGFGLRIMVDSERRANLRIDFGFGPDYGPDHASVRAIEIRFTEAF